jgi:hypothetical protein
VSQHSPHQEKNQISDEDESMGNNVSLTPHGNNQLVSEDMGCGVLALPRGGRCYGSPGQRQHGSSSSSEHSSSGSNNRQNRSVIGRGNCHPGHGGRGHPGCGGCGQHSTRKGAKDSASSSDSLSYRSFSSFSSPKMETLWCLLHHLHQQLAAMVTVTLTVTKASRQELPEAHLAEPGKRRDLY